MEGNSLPELAEHCPKRCGYGRHFSWFLAVCLGSCSQFEWSTSYCWGLCSVWYLLTAAVWAIKLSRDLLQVLCKFNPENDLH